MLRDPAGHGLSLRVCGRCLGVAGGLLWLGGVLCPIGIRVRAHPVAVAERLPQCTTTTFSCAMRVTLGAETATARSLGVRLHATRGSMDRGRAAGGLPPDELMERTGAVLAASQAAVEAFRDPAPEAMVRMGVVPARPSFMLGPRRRCASWSRGPLVVEDGVLLSASVEESASAALRASQTLAQWAATRRTPAARHRPHRSA